MDAEGEAQPVVGILVGDGFDEWLDTLGMSLDTFTNQMMGSWVFNYVQALQAAGVRSVLYCISTQVSIPTRLTHRPTGVTMVVLPSPQLHQIASRVRGWLSQHPYSAAGRLQEKSRGGVLSRTLKAIASTIKAYLTTPLFVLFKELRHDGCRTLLVQEYESPRFDLCVLMGRLKQVQVFGTFTCGLPGNLFDRTLRRVAIRLCAGLAIGACSEVERVKRQYRVRQDKLALVYSPVDLDIFYPSPRENARASLGIPSQVKLAMYHGRIELWYKGLDVLLEAWKLFLENRSEQDFRLLLIGTGSDAEELAKLLSGKQLKGIQWLNEWVHDRTLICRYLSAADVYVFPSRGDACPNAVIEAMACGLPIVASHVNGIADILEGDEQSVGVLVPLGDASALAQAVGRVLDNQPLSSELGRCARRRAETSFSMEVIGKQLSSLLLGGRP